MAVAADHVPISADRVCPLLVGKSIPQLAVQSSDGAAFDLNAAIREKAAILVFYRGGW